MTILLLALLPLSIGAIAAEKRAAPPPDPTEDPLILSGGFLTHHPDLRYRLLGIEAYKDKKLEKAMKFFVRAGYYSDKASQGMVGEMLWNGEGAPKDRALAYVWMDLAAERGYRGFLLLREKYWREMSEDERARALAEGPALYAVNGDAAARERLNRELRRGRRQTTGSRTGFTGNMQIIVPGPGGSQQVISGSKFYDERYWDPEQYAQWHDQIWMKPRVGTVDIGDVEKVEEVGTRIRSAAPNIDAPEPEVPDEPAPKPTP
ncbi:sel1 repeat family protein [Lysobacter silvisoli]|uniref:Sel1 repeat family protein n=1 Tax=Lysobacter silvisoli TaxID=2293254 RepID=A0A371JXS9_9GAMM|nr:sel1 repeat family protein [Lysobacter silvisoli]RDZ26444.1 sel1 repeat family protein [Lysobacter silvisoli]